MRGRDRVAGVDKVLRDTLEDCGAPDPEVKAVVTDCGHQVALLYLTAPDLEVLLHHHHHVVVNVLKAAKKGGKNKGQNNEIHD